MELKEVFEPIVNFLKNFQRKDKEALSKDKAKERLQLVLMQDRASVSPDFFEMMKKEIIEVIKKYIEIDEETLEVQLTRGFEGDGTGPALYANIPIKNIKPVAKKVVAKEDEPESEHTAEELANTIIEDIKQVSEEKSKNVDKFNNKNKKKNKHNKNNYNQPKEEKVDKVETAENINEEVANAVEEITETVEDKVDEAVETIEKTENEINENVDKIEEIAEQIDEEVTEEIEETIEETTEDQKKFKSKIDEMKDGVTETFSKVKAQAKDSIEKIKSKVKAKN